MGIVYRAEHKLIHRIVALKVIHPGRLQQPDAVERFHREAELAAQLSHPNIVTVFDAENIGDTHMMVQEYVEGSTLAYWVYHHGPLPVGEACRYALQVALGLQHAYEQGLVHRDIKPQNLLRTSRGQVKIADFGLARLVSEGAVGGLTAEGAIMGSADYIAPEQIRSVHSCDIRADLYSLGCTLYFLLAGKAPFEGLGLMEKLKAHAEKHPPLLSELRPELDPKLVRLVGKLMAKNPTLRFQTPRETAEALAPFADGGVRLLGEQQPPVTREVVSVQVPDAASDQRRSSTPLRRVAASLVAFVLLIAVSTPIVYRIAIKRGNQVITSKPPAPPRPAPEPPHPPDFPKPEPAPIPKPPAPPTPIPPQEEGPLEVTVETVKPVTGDGSGEIIRFRGRRDRIRRAVFTADGRQIVFASDQSDWEEPQGGKPCEDSLLWFAELSTPPKVSERNLAQTHWVAAEPCADGRLAITADLDGTVRRIDLQTGQSRALVTLSRPFHGAAIASDARRAVLALGDRVAILDLDSGKVLHTLTEHRGTVAGVALTPDATRVMTVGYRDNQVLVWDLVKGSILHKMHHENGVHNVVAMPDGARFVTSGFDGTIRIWDLATGSELRRMPTPAGQGAALAISPDGHLLLAGWLDSIWVWDLRAMQVVARIAAPDHEVFALAFSPDGKRFVSTGFDRTVRVWQLPTIPESLAVEEAEFLLPTRTDILWSVILSPDRRFLAVPGSPAVGTGALYLWDLSRRRLMLRVPSAGVVSPCIGAFTADGRYLVTAGGDGRVRLWNLTTGELPQTLGEQEGTGNLVAISQNGRLAATTAQAGAGVDQSIIHLWSLESGAEVGQLKGPFAGATQIAFMRDGLHLLSSHSLTRVVVWDLESGAPQWSLKGEGGKLVPMPDGRRALLARGNVVQIIDIKTGGLIREFIGHTQSIVLVEPSPDGRFLLTTAYESPDSSARVWDLTTGRQVLKLDIPGHPGTGGWLGERRHFVFGDLLGAVHLYRLSETVSGPDPIDKPSPKPRGKGKSQTK